jgi:serine phosphatase RsbU (regulator of sigma subunit)/tetratricopeptide (TPR) repeat protein
LSNLQSPHKQMKKYYSSSSYSFKLLFTTITLVFAYLYTNAQASKIDSIKTFLQTAKEDTVKANGLNELARAYLFERNDFTNLYKYATQLLTLSQKLHFKKGIAYGYLNTAVYFKSKGEYKTSLEFDFRSLKLMREIGNKKGESSCYIGIGQNYIDLGNYPEATNYTLRGIKMKEEIDDKRGVATGYNNLGNIFLYQNKFQEALHYQLISLKIKQEINDKVGMGMSYNNLGLVYYSQLKLDTALIYLKKALQIKEDLKDKIGMSTTYTNIGNIYFEQKNWDEALRYQIKSLNVSEEASNKRGLLTAFNAIGSIYEQKKDYPAAINYYNKTLSISKEIDMKQGILEGYKSLSSVYKASKQFENSLKYFNMYHEVKDSLLNKENFKQLAELNTRYETDKKEKEILLLTKDQLLNAKIIKQQQLVRWGLTAGLGLLIISIISIYRRYRFKQKANIILEKQKEEIQQKNILITDSIDYAKTIQEAVLPTIQKVKNMLPESFILYKPKAIVSGDFYWLNTINDQLICAVADCTGHGVPGAFMSLLGYNMLEDVTKTHPASRPAAILDVLNHQVMTRLSGDDKEETTKHGMDISLISIDPTTDVLEFAGAHNSLYIVRNKELIELKADKMNIGANKLDRSFTNQFIELKKGDMIYLFTDGFPDQIGGPNRKKFYYQPFKDLLISISSLTPDEQKIKLDEAHTLWMGRKRDQTDDILIMGICYS